MFKSNTFQIIIIYNNTLPIILRITYLLNYSILFSNHIPNYPDNNNTVM